MAARRPWYGVAYYVLGTRGSFFAWVLALLGVYVTWREAALFAWNQGPVARRVAEVTAAEPGFRRWVQVGGVEIDLGSALFAAQDRALGTAGAFEDRILIDRDDPVAVAWRSVFREIEAARAALEPDTATRDRPAGGDESDAALKRLGSLLLEIGSAEAGKRYVPEKALFVITGAPVGGAGSGVTSRTGVAGALGNSRPEASPPGAPQPPPEDSLSRWRRSTLARVDLVRSAVSIDVEREGLLETLPESRRARYKEAYGVEVARAALGVGHRPSHVAACAFGGFAFLLLLLAIGLRAGAK